MIGGLWPAGYSTWGTTLVQTGKVYWVGAGPGHPELLTLKAAALLKGADVIIVMPRSPFTTPRIWIG